MSQHPDFVSEFLGRAQRNPLGLQTDRVAVESQIAESTRSAEEVKAAFQAMQQAQQPTTFDKIGDVALAVAAIADLSGGGGSLADRRKRSEAGAKFRSLRAGRTERKQTKRDRQFQKFIQQMKLREFTGDIANRNLALAMGLTEQERQITKANLDVIIQARRDATSEEQFQKKFDLEEKKINALIEKGKKSAAQTAAESNREAGKEARKAVGKFDLDAELDLMGQDGTTGTVTPYQHWLGRVSVLKDQILAEEYGITPSPEEEQQVVQGEPVSGLIQPELLPDIGMRDLIGQSIVPPQTTRAVEPERFRRAFDIKVALGLKP